MIDSQIFVVVPFVVILILYTPGKCLGMDLLKYFPLEHTVVYWLLLECRSAEINEKYKILSFYPRLSQVSITYFAGSAIFMSIGQDPKIIRCSQNWT